jgi:L,D-transpeptidase catalytic domain
MRAMRRPQELTRTAVSASLAAIVGAAVPVGAAHAADAPSADARPVAPPAVAQAPSGPEPVRPIARREATIARVVAPVAARRAPDRSAPAVWTVPTATGWSGQAQALLVLRSARDADGRRWLQLELPIRPNERTGWIPADYAMLSRTGYWIEVSTGRRLVSVFRAGRLVRRFGAVVGAPGTPTPHGLFALWEKNPQPDVHGFLGPWSLPITALSSVLESFGGGPGRVAIHGRDGASLLTPLGSAASHGCIRVDNVDVAWLAARIPRGTPVRIAD